MSQQPTPSQNPPTGHEREQLSAAADGQADALGHACQAWRGSGDARRTWHTYHLIGDVMRSGELALPPGRDAAFLQALRGRLAEEPVVLAPLPKASAASTGANRWWLSAAAAAGFVAVAGVLLVTRQSAPETTPAPMASQGTAPGAVAVIRDERLDEFLRAHQATRGGMGAALPGGALRRVELEVPAPR